MSNIANDDRCELSFESLRMTKVGEEVKFNFLWTIKNFSARPQEIGERLCSSLFHIQAPDDIKSEWDMQLHPKGYYHFSPSTTGNTTSVSVRNFLSVRVNNYSEREFLAKTNLSILDEARKRHYRKNGNSRDDWEKYGTNGHPLEFLSLNKLHSKASVLLPNDCLTILCEVTILIPDKSDPVSVDGGTKMVQPSQENLQNELAFSQKDFTDVQIQCGDKIFECHEFILSARSPVFKAMFQVEMKEKKTKKVVVKDIHPDVFEELLTFIYTGKCPNVNKLARDLLGAADMYQVELLKTICIEKLCNSINVHNCVDLLIIGDMYQADILKKISLEFIAMNVGSVCDLGDWKKSLLGNPSLMADVIKAIGRNDIRGKVAHGVDPEEYYWEHNN